jgi:hypothetical protein
MPLSRLDDDQPSGPQCLGPGALGGVKRCGVALVVSSRHLNPQGHEPRAYEAAYQVFTGHSDWKGARSIPSSARATGAPMAERVRSHSRLQNSGGSNGLFQINFQSL